MFFVGVFGIGPREESKPLAQAVDGCPNPVLIRRCRQFHIFFISVYRWHVEYLIRCGHDKVMAVKADVGEKLWNGEETTVGYWDVKVLYEALTCPQCGREIAPGDRYCSQCGSRLG